MGFGGYSTQAHKALISARAEQPASAIFTSSDCDPSMNPLGIVTRESRDSADHPDSVGIVFALDVSGSMGEIPRRMATESLPDFMESALAALPDAQVLFMAFGNAWTDRAPLQVGQFESTAALMDRWLSTTYLEGAGGGWGESYELALYFGARHIAMDCVQVRGRKGYFFMTGDEVPFVAVDPGQVKGLIGATIDAPIAVHEIVAELQHSFHVFFLIPDRERADTLECGGVWRRLLAERAIVLETAEDTTVACALLLGIQEGQLPDEAAIRRSLAADHERSGEPLERVVRAVLPFALALATGPIAGPQSLSARRDKPPVQG